MAFPPQKFREIVFQILYSKNFVFPEKELCSMMMKELKVTKKIILEASFKAREVAQKFDVLDPSIEKLLKNYTFDRISSVEKTILRLSAYELLYSELPHEIVFAEAARLTKKFGSKEGAQFVNAILDSLYSKNSCPTD